MEARLEVLEGLSKNLSGMHTIATEAMTRVGDLSERLNETGTAIERITLVLDDEGGSGSLVARLSEVSERLGSLRELTTRLTEASTATKSPFSFFRR